MILCLYDVAILVFIAVQGSPGFFEVSWIHTSKVEVDIEIFHLVAYRMTIELKEAEANAESTS